MSKYIINPNAIAENTIERKHLKIEDISATTEKPGVVQLANDINNDSKTKAATSYAVKRVYDYSNALGEDVNNLQNDINNINYKIDNISRMHYSNIPHVYIGALQKEGGPYTGTNFCAYSDKITGAGKILVADGYYIDIIKIFDKDGIELDFQSGNIDLLSFEFVAELDFQFGFRKKDNSAFNIFELDNIISYIRFYPQKWDDYFNVDNYTCTGVYEFYGNRTDNIDNMPILNKGYIEGNLKVIANTNFNTNLKTVMQILTLLNVGAGDGNIYTRTFNNDNWSDWSKLQTSFDVGEVETLDDIYQDGVYEGILKPMNGFKLIESFRGGMLIKGSYFEYSDLYTDFLNSQYANAELRCATYDSYIGGDRYIFIAGVTEDNKVVTLYRGEYMINNLVPPLVKDLMYIGYPNMELDFKIETLEDRHDKFVITVINNQTTQKISQFAYILENNTNKVLLKTRIGIMSGDSDDSDSDNGITWDEWQDVGGGNDYILPVATSTTLGGIKSSNVDICETPEGYEFGVKIGSEGMPYVKIPVDTYYIKPEGGIPIGDLSKNIDDKFKSLDSGVANLNTTIINFNRRFGENYDKKTFSKEEVITTLRDKYTADIGTIVTYYGEDECWHTIQYIKNYYSGAPNGSGVIESNWQEIAGYIKIINISESSLNDYTDNGEYHITGERINSEDGLPILNMNGYIEGTLKVITEPNTNISTQILTLLNVGGGDGNIYTRIYQNGTWKPWGKLQTNIEVNAIGVGQSKSFNDLIDNGMYSGVNYYWHNEKHETYGAETFVLIVINAWLFGADITQLKYGINTEGEVNIKTRKGNKNTEGEIMWDEWINVGEKHSTFLNPIEWVGKLNTLSNGVYEFYGSCTDIGSGEKNIWDWADNYRITPEDPVYIKMIIVKGNKSIIQVIGTSGSTTGQFDVDSETIL